MYWSYVAVSYIVYLVISCITFIMVCALSYVEDVINSLALLSPEAVHAYACLMIT